METRPLMQNGIGTLEAMFAESSADSKVLHSLEAELKHRQVPRAIALLKKVEKAIRLEKVPEADTEAETMSPERARLTELLRRNRSLATEKQPALWPENEDVAPAMPATSASAVPATPAPSKSSQVEDAHVLVALTAEKSSLKADIPSMSVGEAYQRLQAATGTT